MILAETASLTRDTEWLATRLADKPEILAAVNRSRSRQGMCPIVVPPADPAAAAIGVARGSVRSAPVLRDVVWIVSHYGVAPRVIGRRMPERILGRAFGTAEQLNAPGAGWYLRANHDGLMLEARGDRLRAFDAGDVGMAFMWEPDPSLRHHRDALAAIEAGRCGVSVGFTSLKRTPGSREEWVVRGVLRYIAILTDGSQPAYRGAVAQVFRNADPSPDATQRQLASVMATARLREHGRRS